MKLCVNYITKAKYYGTRIDLTKPEFQARFCKKADKGSTIIKNNLHIIEGEAKELIRMIKPFSFSAFEKKFGQAPTKKAN